MKRPSFQFYPGDWLNDSKLNLCGASTHGVWMELLCHMHQSDRRGFLSFGDRKLDRSDILKLSKFSPKVVRKAIDELTTFGILLEDEDFGFYSKRMVKDERLSALREDAGKLGGNPNLVNQNPSKTKKNANQKPTPSSSTSSSSSINIPLGKKTDKNENFVSANAKTERKSNRAYSEESKSLVQAFKKLLQESGQTTFQRDWYLTSLACCESLLKQGKPSAEIEKVMRWAVLEWDCKKSITHFKHVTTAYAHYERQNIGIKPPGTGYVEKLLAAERIVNVFNSEDVRSGQEYEHAGGGRGVDAVLRRKQTGEKIRAGDYTPIGEEQA